MDWNQSILAISIHVYEVVASKSIPYEAGVSFTQNSNGVLVHYINIVCARRASPLVAGQRPRRPQGRARGALYTHVCE
ncbi:unnamed protein product [Arctia plantaginis]|uniref:Uncharacterized protein n=1 Tax=Arctia plantaginis TaxID=874455 RepID=A0A8S1ACR1_ARCPL|nr:unnamed protein product [Arctia plantaginis]